MHLPNVHTKIVYMSIWTEAEETKTTSPREAIKRKKEKANSGNRKQNLKEENTSQN